MMLGSKVDDIQNGNGLALQEQQGGFYDSKENGKICRRQFGYSGNV